MGAGNIGLVWDAVELSPWSCRKLLVLYCLPCPPVCMVMRVAEQKGKYILPLEKNQPKEKQLQWCYTSGKFSFKRSQNVIC